MRHIRTLYAALTAAAVFMTGCSSSSDGSSAVQTPTVEPTTIDPHSIVFEWQGVYENKLHEFEASAEFRNGIAGSRFDLRDINGDAIPELFISPSNEASALCKVYSYSGGELVRIETGEKGGSGEVGFLAVKNVLKLRYFGESFEMGSYCSVNGSELTELVSYYNNRNSLYSGTQLRYEINGAEVSLGKYEEALSGYIDSAELVLGRKYTFSPSSISYAIHDSESWGVVLTDKVRALYKQELASHLDKSDAAAAFELCDLNGDKVPELIYSEGSFDFALCRIYAVEDGRLVERSSGIGSGGRLMFDTKSGTVCTVENGRYKSWDYDSGELKEYTPSDGLMELGRKYILSAESITSALR